MQTELTTEERNWGMAAHLSALIAVAGLPFGHVVGPLIVYLVKGAESPFVARHARASLNYQITVSLVAIVWIIVAICIAVVLAMMLGASGGSKAGDEAMALGMVVVWIAILGGVGIAVVLSLIFIILGTVAASEGRPYRYPFAIDFIREPR